MYSWQLANLGKWKSFKHCLQNKELILKQKEGTACILLKRNGNTALMFAAKSGQIEAVKLLLDNGADRDAKDA